MGASGREPFAPWGAALRGELLSVGSCSPWGAALRGELLSVGSCSPWGAALRGELLSVGSCSPWGAALRGELLSVGSCSPWGAALRAELLSVGRCSPWGGALRGEKGLGVTWDVPLYGELLKIGGGKERMTHYFNQVGWPQAAPIDPSERAAFVAGLHKSKTALFMQLVETGALPLRPGVARLIDEALAAGVRVAVCSTSNEKAVGAIVRVMLGEERAQHMRIFAGDVVPKKKPDPAIYNLAATTLSLNPARGGRRYASVHSSAGSCMAIEDTLIRDSHIGLTAAKAAGMTCVVTKSGYCCLFLYLLPLSPSILHGGRGLFSDACLTPLVTHMTRTLCSCSAVSPTHLPHLPPLPLLRPSPTSYTEDEDFSAADAVFDAIGDTPADGFDLPFLASLL
ncbi:unnamed protein product [Closterium sp. NIES-64]|nr:unnamed protein product [Closterium sp. NIES-64]